MSEKDSLINEIRKLMTPKTYSRPLHNSNNANKIVDKLLVRLGIIAIIGMLGYIIIKGSTNKNKECRC